MATNEILPFAPNAKETQGDILSQGDYQSDTQRLNGQSGLGRRALNNKALRQSSHMAAGVAQFIANRGTDVMDDGDLDKVEAGLTTAIEKAVDLPKLTKHIGATGDAHGVATTTENGFMSSTDKAKHDTIETGANKYTHPTGDGNLHVPATGTGNNGKVLRAGATAGSLAWEELTAGDVTSTATGNLTAVNVQAAIEELELEKQPKNDILTALAKLVTAADQMIYSTGVGLFAMSKLTTFARKLLGDADAAAARKTLGAAPVDHNHDDKYYTETQVDDLLKSKASVDSPDLTGTPTAPTAAAETNTTQIATTAWVRTAMTAIMKALGFAISLGENGYIKLPSCLGGLMFQWGTVAVATTVVHPYGNIAFPVFFPTTICYISGTAKSLINGGEMSTGYYIPVIGFDQLSTTGARWAMESNNAAKFSGTVSFNWFAIGN